MSKFSFDDYVKIQATRQHESNVSSTYQLTLKNVSTQSVEDLSTLTIEELQERVKSGALTYEAITMFYLNRIYAYESMHAVLEINEHAILEAKEKFYSDDHDKMYGIPVLVKGNIGTKDMATSAGAAFLKERYVDDARIIEQLKEKGAIVIGKTNLSEWANFMSKSGANGYSVLGGQTKNPYGLFDVGGSSSGSAVAAACALAPVTIGTETAGSIIYPASQNGVVGLKPTWGLLSCEGIIPIAESYDTPGPMGRYVQDVYHLLRSMTEIQLKRPRYKKDIFKYKKVGIVGNDAVTTYYRDGDRTLLFQAETLLKMLGSEVVEYFINEEAFEIETSEIFRYEFQRDIGAHLQGYELKDVIAFNQADLKNRAPYNQEILIEACETVYDEQKMKEQRQINRERTRSAIDEALKEVDVLMTLSNYCTSLYASAGYPAISIPVGYRASGEPVGITFLPVDMMILN